MDLRYKKIAVKIGSNVLTCEDKTLDLARMALLVDQLSMLKKSGVEIVLVSSGAVAAGRSEIHLDKKLDDVSARQLYSAIGQVRLINHYYDLFRENGLVCAQVLTTKENFKDRRHYLNMKNCINTLVDCNVIPIINENDTISITELMFTDNDELSGLIASLIGAEALIILTNVNGVYAGDPSNSESELIQRVELASKDLTEYIGEVKSEFGRGGMLTKSKIARKIAKEGISVHIANGKRERVLSDLMDVNKKVPHTWFIPRIKSTTNVKRWLSHSESFAQGAVIINNGAAEALLSSNASSLLLIGIVVVNGYFKKGDLVSIVDLNGIVLGIGKAQYDSAKTLSLVGSKRSKPFIHYDYLHLYD